MTYTSSLWDRTSTINGASPGAILVGYPDIPADSPIVLISNENDVVMQVQPTDPSKPGWSWWENEEAATAWADATVDGLNNPPEPVEPEPVPEPEPQPEPEVPVTRAEFNELLASFDWLTNFVVTGEA